MRVAAIFVLAMLVAGVVCEETPVEAEHRHHHKHHDDGSHGSHSSLKKACACTANLSPFTLTTANGCNTTLTCGVDAGAYCNNATLSAVCASGSTTCGLPNTATITGQLGPNAQIGTCAGPQASLCIQVTCPLDGFITISADAAPKGSCSGTDQLYLYKNAALEPANILPDNNNVMNVFYSGACTRGQQFFVCEKDGIIITSSVKASFVTQVKNQNCPSGTTQLQCLSD